MRQLNHLKEMTKTYPKAWHWVDELRRSKGKDLPNWPDWCLLPMGGWYMVVSEIYGGKVPYDRGNEIGQLAAIGAWRYTQGIYRFDPTIFENLWETKLSGNIPGDVLLRLPQWCVYIETPGQTWHGDDDRLYGFYAHLEKDSNDGRHELRLLLDTDSQLIPVPLHIGNWSLEEAIAKASEEARRHAPPSFQALSDGLSKYDSVIAKFYSPMISLILYLCSGEPDFGPGKKPARPKSKKTKKGLRLFPPNGPTIWNIGENIGRQIREATEKTASSETGRTVAAHIRSAHWHGYWTGPKTGKQTFVYHWMPPIPVNVESFE